MAGSVAVFLPKEVRQLQWEVEEAKQAADPSGFSFESSIGVLGKPDCQLSREDFKQYPYIMEKGTGVSKYIYRTVLGRGLRFGELGIANKVPRSATILANVQVCNCRKTAIWLSWTPPRLRVYY